MRIYNRHARSCSSKLEPKLDKRQISIFSNCFDENWFYMVEIWECLNLTDTNAQYALKDLLDRRMIINSNWQSLSEHTFNSRDGRGSNASVIWSWWHKDNRYDFIIFCKSKAEWQLNICFVTSFVITILDLVCCCFSFKLGHAHAY